MLVKSYDLTGEALDWAVELAKGTKWLLKFGFFFENDNGQYYSPNPQWNYSKNSNQVLNMLKEYKISLMHVEDNDPYPIDDGPWSASIPGQEFGYTGPTP